jgi:hypothetical protein
MLTAYFTTNNVLWHPTNNRLVNSADDHDGTCRGLTADCSIVCNLIVTCTQRLLSHGGVNCGNILRRQVLSKALGHLQSMKGSGCLFLLHSV